MIPKSLLTTFLSLKITTDTGAPPQANRHDVEAPAHAQRVDFGTPPEAPVTHDWTLVPDPNYGVELEDYGNTKLQQSLTVEASNSDVAITQQHVFPVCRRSLNSHLSSSSSFERAPRMI